MLTPSLSCAPALARAPRMHLAVSSVPEAVTPLRVTPPASMPMEARRAVAASGPHPPSASRWSARPPSSCPPSKYSSASAWRIGFPDRSRAAPTSSAKSKRVPTAATQASSETSHRPFGCNHRANVETARRTFVRSREPPPSLVNDRVKLPPPCQSKKRPKSKEESKSQAK